MGYPVPLFQAGRPALRMRGGIGMFGCLLVLTVSVSHAQEITLLERDAVVWSADQQVRGTAEVANGILFVNDQPHPFAVAEGAFSVPVRLQDGLNTIVACSDGPEAGICSDTLRWTLGYNLRPEIYAYATVSGRTVTLHGRVLADPDSSELAFRWRQHPDNPAFSLLTGTSDSVASIRFLESAPAGEYYFDLTVSAASGDSSRARTYVTVSPDSIQAFDLESDHASWIDSAVIYEVLPYAFTTGRRLRDVTTYLPELAELGVNTIWLQPIFESWYEGMGYDVTDFFKIRSNLGTEEDLRELVFRAHELGMRVIMDFVPNHTSIFHPYAQDAIENGQKSHYADFYQQERDNAPYSVHYNLRRVGNMDFIYYFWNELVNLNYDHPEVQTWIREGTRYWIEQFDIDGYRLDAVWGVTARAPESMQNLRFDLKRLKPEIMLLGEDKATVPSVFDNRFDVAFDWYPEIDWVSHWTWQTHWAGEDNPTLFNASPGQRSRLLRDALTNQGRGFSENAKVLRFMENNDLSRFLTSHTIDQTRMAATLLFSLPGIPMLYMGQEIGVTFHPYTERPIFRNGRTIREQDNHGLFPFYRHLINVRLQFPALTGPNFREVPIDPASISAFTLAYHRWHEDQNIYGLINMSNGPVNARLALSPENFDIEPAKTYYLTDLTSGEYLTYTGSDLGSVDIEIEGHTTRLFILDDQVVAVPTGSDSPSHDLPDQITLMGAYPNPFSESTLINFELPESGQVRLEIFDVLGRSVTTLVDDFLLAGKYAVNFTSGNHASGMYFYRLNFQNQSYTKSLLLVR